ncbi:hypothetical protein D3C71_1814810 [compost metagenome]
MSGEDKNFAASLTKLGALEDEISPLTLDGAPLSSAHWEACVLENTNCMNALAASLFFAFFAIPKVAVDVLATTFPPLSCVMDGMKPKSKPPGTSFAISFGNHRPFGMNASLC